MSTELPYKFKIPIGDWSNDGHGRCDWYFVFSNKPVEDVREAHFEAIKKTGIDITTICHEYEDYQIRDKKVIDFMIEKNIISDAWVEREEDAHENEKYDDQDIEVSYDTDSSDLVRLWIALLHEGDPELRLELQQGDDIPMLPFYGMDRQHRHINFVGYGVFTM